MATKSKEQIREDLQEAVDQEAQALAAPAVQHRTTGPAAPRMADATSASQVGRIQAVLQAAGYSRDDSAYPQALVALQGYRLPPTTKPEVSIYLAEALDYVQGKAQPPTATGH